jgi:hypothetical protein
MNISSLLYKYVFFYRYIVDYFWTIVSILFIVIWILLIKRYKISGQQTALIGFILLGVTMVFNLFYVDEIAGKIAEFVWILFAIAFIQQFTHYLKHENK